MKIVGKTWFTEMGSTRPIGVVIIETEIGQSVFERKAYIGTAFGVNEMADARHIAERGAKFPVDMAEKLCL